MSNPRKHHYLSQFYLKGFSADGKGLLQIEKATLNSYSSTIKDAAAARDYHILDYDDAPDPQAFEKALSVYEGELSVTLERVLMDGLRGPKDKFDILSLLSLMRFRVPAFKAYIENSLRGLARATGLLLERNGGLPAPPLGLERRVNMSTVDIHIKNWACLHHMFKLATDPDLIQLMLRMQHTIIHAPTGQTFLTCDQPVAMFSPSANATDASGVDFISKDVELTFPLSSSQILKLSWDKGAADTKIANASEMVELNRRTVITADSRIFASGEYDGAKAFVKNFRTFSAGMQLGAIDAGSTILQTSWFRPVMRPEAYKA